MDPIPNASAPARMYSGMFEDVMPPTGANKVLVGNTDRNALTACGVITSAGKSLRRSAPSVSAEKASLGVQTPGQ